MSSIIFERIADSESIPPQLKKLLADYVIANQDSAEGQKTIGALLALIDKTEDADRAFGKASTKYRDFLESLELKALNNSEKEAENILEAFERELSELNK